MYNGLVCIWRQVDAQNYHNGGRSQTLYYLRQRRLAPASLVPPSLTDSEKVNFSPILHDVNAELVWSK